jgi:hypothetical protein
MDKMKGFSKSMSVPALLATSFSLAVTGLATTRIDVDWITVVNKVDTRELSFAWCVEERSWVHSIFVVEDTLVCTPPPTAQCTCGTLSAAMRAPPTRAAAGRRRACARLWELCFDIYFSSKLTFDFAN